VFSSLYLDRKKALGYAEKINRSYPKFLVN
jgi:hypothetical protein